MTRRNARTAVPTHGASDIHRPQSHSARPIVRDFSFYPDADILGDIYAAVGSHGNPHWASAEGTNVDIHTLPFRIPDEGMEDYLARMFNHGATVTNVFGFDVGDKENLFRRATESDEAVAAYRKFLRGARLNETPLTQSYQRRPNVLQSHMRALPGRIESYLRAGGDPHLIQPQVKQLEEYMKDGRLDAMKQLLDQIETIVDSKVEGKPDAASKGFDVAALQQQMRALPQKIETFQQHHGEMTRIKARVESIQMHIDAGELEKAFEELQALKPILESP